MGTGVCADFVIKDEAIICLIKLHSEENGHGMGHGMGHGITFIPCTKFCSAAFQRAFHRLGLFVIKLHKEWRSKA